MNKKETKLACGYIRMSSGKQESSPAQQRREITALAERKGYQIVAWYADERISGDEIEKRPEFCRMLSDARDGKFQVILCWDQDRFGRFDSLRAGYVIEPLRMAGVRLVTVTQGEIDWTDFAGRMIYAIQQEGKNQFLVSLSNNIMRGLLQSAREGHGAKVPPIGYDRVFYDESGKPVHRASAAERFAKPRGWKSKLDISANKQEVDAVRWMFREYADTSADLRSIGLGLDRLGIRPRHSGSWSMATVKAMLKNVTYVGTWVFGKLQTGRFNWVGNGGVGGEGPVVIENNHPAIIDAETFERVQQKMKNRSRPWGRQRKTNYYLSGLLYCGNTGATMCGRRASVGNRCQYYCTLVEHDSATEFYSIRKECLEEFVIRQIAEMLSAPEAEQRIREAVVRRLRSGRKTHEAARLLKQQIAELDRKIARGAERLLLLDGEDLGDASAALSEWRKKRRTLADRLETAGISPNSPPERETARVLAELADLRETFQLADPARLRAALRTVLRDVTLYWAPGGPRKWRFVRGVIRFGDNLLFSDNSPSKSTPTRRKLTVR